MIVPFKTVVARRTLSGNLDLSFLCRSGRTVILLTHEKHSFKVARQSLRAIWTGE